MEVTNLTLAYQVLEIKPLLEGSTVNKIQELPNNWLKVRLRTANGSRELVVAKNIFFLTSFSIPAKQTTSGFGAFLNKHLNNKKILSMQQHGFDRIVQLEFQDYFLILEFFAKGNIILCSRDWKILSAYRKEQWKDRTLKKDEPYKFPSSRGANPAEVPPKELVGMFKGKEKAIVALINGVNVAPILAEDIFAQAKIQKEKPAHELSGSEVKKIHALLKEFYGKISLKKMKPVLIESNDSKILLPFAVKVPDAKALEQFSSLNAALDELLAAQTESKQEVQEKGAFEKNLKALQHSLQQQREAIENQNRISEQNREKAELIYQHYNEITDLMQAISLAKGRKVQEKEVMYKLSRASKLFKDLNLKKGKLLLDLKNKN